jgi:hypothetical protein
VVWFHGRGAHDVDDVLIGVISGTGGSVLADLHASYSRMC